MSKFRKKPIVIDATRWWSNGDYPDDNSKMLIHSETGAEFLSEGEIVRRFRRSDIAGNTKCKACNIFFHQHGWIDTLEGDHIVCPGDWIITGVEGERYPCKPNIFNATYEPAED